VQRNDSFFYQRIRIAQQGATDNKHRNKPSSWKIKSIDNIEAILTDKYELGRLNRSSKAIDFYKSLIFKYSHGERIGLHPRISALNELEDEYESNNGDSRFIIQQRKGGRYTRKTKDSKRKSRKSNK
jgi:hypothetical protein